MRYVGLVVDSKVRAKEQWDKIFYLSGGYNIYALDTQEWHKRRVYLDEHESMDIKDFINKKEELNKLQEILNGI